MQVRIETEGDEQYFEPVLDVTENDDGEIEVQHVNDEDRIVTETFPSNWRITGAWD